MTKQVELDQKAKQSARRIIRLPFVRMVVLTGSVAAGRAKQKSDIDFLIVAKYGRIYLARAIVVIMAKIWGEYRSNKNIAGKLCLNWFLTDNLAFDINALKIEFKLKIKNFKLNEGKVGKVKLLKIREQENGIEKLLSGKIGDLLETIAKKYQICRIKKDLRTHVGGSKVRWADDELGFHPPK